MNSNYLKTTLKFLFLAVWVLALSACKTTAPAEKTPEKEQMNENSGEIKVEAEDFLAASEGMAKSTDGATVLTQADSKGWMTYEVEIAQAGRYQTSVLTKDLKEGAASFWVEDFIDNKDGRTYNITGAMSINASDNVGAVQKVSKDGSPLKAGTHKIRLHVKGASLEIDAIHFTMIREHEKTPKIQQQNMEGESWKLVWSDEFDGTGLPDASKWTHDVGDWGWGNHELQYYTVGKTENSRQENGNLIIQARKDDGAHAWTSARLTTRGKVSFLYGKIEFRAKVPPNKGNWAAGWTLGDDYVDESSWPYCGEIDIMESVGFEMEDETGNGKAHASVHCGAYYFKLGNQPTADVPVMNMSEEFHTYSVIWTPEKITGLVDDKAYFEYSDTSTDLAWPFSRPQNIILNLAMGGGWGGAQGMDKSMTQQDLIIDYVRVYELE